MTNIPTDLLRTFVSVVELRSFTRAAKAQGMTQPAVSAQIRRLQGILGVELLDKTAPGVALTPLGEHILSSARRMLSVNDHITQLATPNAPAHIVRIGLPGAWMGTELTRMLVAARVRFPNLRFAVEGAGQKRLLQSLKQDEIDLVVALALESPDSEARHYWKEELVWVRSKAFTYNPDTPLPLISYKDICLSHRIAVTTLAKASRANELVFRASNGEGLRSGVAAGLGVMVMPRRCVPRELEIWEDGTLPALPLVFCGIFARESDLLDEVADCFAETLRPAPAMKVASLRAAIAEAARPSA